MPESDRPNSPVRKPVVERWPTRGMFVAVAVALVCGPAIVWRFPSLALRHGGGNFLVAWAVALVVTGLPLLVLELALGQRTQRAAPRAFRAMHRRWESVGWAGVLIAFAIGCLQLLLGAQALTIAFPALQVAAEGAETMPWRDPVDFVFRHLHGTSGPGGWQFPPVGVIIALVAVWAVAGFLASSGPRLFGGILRLILVGTVGMLLAVVARQLTFLGVADSGAIDGLAAGLDLQPARLGDLGLWVDAFTHALLACGVGFGAHTLLAAYLPREADVANNGLFVGLVSATLSFVCWLAIACTLGMLALSDGRQFHEVTASFASYQPDGVGLSLLVYPQALLLGDLGGSARAQAGWTATLYIAIAGLALASSVVMLHAGIGALHERLARSRRRLGLAVTGTGLLLTLALAGIVGWEWFDIADSVLVGVGLTVIAILECICLGWIAGTADLREQINRTSERRVGILWEVTVRMLTPLLLTFLLVNSLMRV